MEFLVVIYILIFVVFALVATAILQIRMAGIKVKDFWGFIQANELLDKLYKFAKRSKTLTPQEQIVFFGRSGKSI